MAAITPRSDDVEKRSLGPSGAFCRGAKSTLTATLTATSVDGLAEGVAEGVDGLALEAEAYVGVDAGGDADVGVAEEFLDDDEVDALFQEQGRGRVPEIVGAP